MYRTRSDRPILFVFLVVAICFCAVWFFHNQTGLVYIPVVMSMAIGAFVGFVEVLGRYQHAPWRAITNWASALYILINMLAAWLAYYLLGEFKVFENVEEPKEVKQVLAAGFGALVFLRSSLFKIQVDESPVGIGPAAILDMLLLVVDRGLDRREAVARSQDVTRLAANWPDPEGASRMLATYCIALMRNVDKATQEELQEDIKQILEDPQTPSAIKIDVVALKLGILVGPEVLEAAVTALGDRLGEVTAGLPTLGELEKELES